MKYTRITIIFLFLLIYSLKVFAFDDQVQQSEWTSDWNRIKSQLQSSSLSDYISARRGLVESFEGFACIQSRSQDCTSYDSKSLVSVSVSDGKFSVSSGFVFLYVIVDLLGYVSRKKSRNNYIQNLRYDDFTSEFPELLVAEYHILRIQKMLQFSKYGTFPEQVFARIHLVQMSLFEPYDKVLNKCAKKLIETSFDKYCRFVWKDVDVAKDSYKKFYTKVPQNWKDIIKYVEQVPVSFACQYDSKYATKVQNDYNQTLLDIIYAGIDKNFPLLKKLCRKYYDKLTTKLYEYYINQHVAKHHNADGAYKSADYDPVIQQLPEQEQKKAAVEMSEELILREFYQKELSDWLLSSSNNLDNAEMYPTKHRDKAILNLPLNPNYRFVLLRNFVHRVCKGSDTPQQISEEFFDQSGILKKYHNHSYVKEHYRDIYLDDELFHKAVNFALAISQKEKDEITQSVAQLILQYVIFAYQQKENEEVFTYYRNKVQVLFEALSYKNYNSVVFDE